MKKAVFLIVFATVVVSSWGVYRYFNKFNRARNDKAPRPVLIVYTHSSFMNPFGPGPKIAEEFSKICLCDIKYVDAGGGQVLIQKLKMATQVDVVLGLDQVSLKKIAREVKFRELTAHKRNWTQVFKDNKYKSFLPYDWAPVTLVYRNKDKLERAGSLVKMLESIPDHSLAVQDPRHSNLGLQLVYWAFNESDQDLDQMAKIAKLVQSKTQQVSADWSGAYGAFKRGMSSYVVSYMTSPVYHLKVENDPGFGAAQVTDGHPIHIEYAAVPDHCRSCGLAKRYVEFLSSDLAQRTLFEKNYMIPVVKGILTPEEENLIPQVKLIGSGALDKFVDQREEILERWTQVAN